ncbi:MAG TPA: polysaccharide biosynthesis tyrosine autokinase [Polyangiaceae bacterium]|nr:polysaccharide biosynthesis tyrosine autokinase [Polyangiaceae bacterium]
MNSLLPTPSNAPGPRGPAQSLRPGDSEEHAFSLPLMARALRKNWFLVVLGVAAFVTGASLYTSRVTRIYEAAATVQLDPQPLMPLGNQSGTPSGGPESYWSNQEYFATQHQILTSRKIADAVVRKLALNRDHTFVVNLPAGPQTAGTEVSVDTAAEILRGRIDVKQIADSRLTRVTYRDADAARAQRVLAALVDEYVDQNLDRTLDSASQRAEWLDTQLVKLKQELESQEMELHDFKKRNNLLSVSFDDQSNMLRAQIQQLNTALTDLKARQERVAARLAVLQGISVENPAAIPQSELLGDGLLKSLRSSYLDAEEQIGRLRAMGKGENHPDVQAATVTLQSSRDALKTEIENIRKGCQADLEAVHRELAGVTRLYETAKAQAMDLNLNEVRYARLRRSKDNTEHVFGVVLERSTESGLSKLMPFNNVRVLDRPLLPGGPVLPRTPLNLALGAALGLIVGLCFAVGRELLDRTVRDPEDVERELSIPWIGSLPDVQGRAGLAALYYGRYSQGGEHKRTQRPEPAPERMVPEMLVHHYPKSAAAEAARAIRTNLLLTSPDRPYKTLLVTSPSPAEGKTMVAASVAIAMSQAGQRVCLVDCDLRRPRVHSVFGSPIDPGVTVAMLDPSRLDEAIIKTPAPNLWVLPAGPTPPNPADLMHSEAFGRLLEALQSRFDRIVIDSPPAGIVTDSVVLSTRVDATLLVVRARRTRRDSARRALRALMDVGGTVPGFIMNAVVASGDSYSYSYYGSYTQDEKSSES